MVSFLFCFRIFIPIDPPPTIGLSRQEPLFRGGDYEPNFRVTSSGTGDYRTTSIDPPQPQLVISGIGADVSLADFHHFLSRWGQVVDSSVTLHGLVRIFLSQLFCAGYGTAQLATWAGTEALLAASPLHFKSMELTVRLPREGRGPSPEPRSRRSFDERDLDGFYPRERHYEPPTTRQEPERTRSVRFLF